MKRTRTSKAWMREHVSDPYVLEARKRGYRSRAAFKLLEIDARDRLLRPGMTVVDLGAAPGSWSQVVVERLGAKGRVIAVDLLPMEPIAGVTLIQVDFNADAAPAVLDQALGGQTADLVLSDMVPNICGVKSADQARSLGLAELALGFCGQCLKPGGDFVVKVFQGGGVEGFVGEVRNRFRTAAVRKPKASRGRSAEVYVVGRGFLGDAGEAA